MDAPDVNKTPDGSAMDIVSMAFSNVSENSDLMEVVSADPSTTAAAVRAAEAGESAPAGTVQDLHGVQYRNMEDMEEGDQSVNQIQEHPDHIEIPLPPNAIITVNDQIIQLAQVVGDDADPDQTCPPIEQVEEIEQVETVIPTPGDNQPGPGGDVDPMSVRGDGLEAMTFQGSDVAMVGDEACVVPVTISLTDVQNLQQVVGGVHVGAGGESAQVSSADIAVTSSAPAGLSAGATSLFSSLASIIDTSSVFTNANMSSNAALSANGVTFVSGAGIPVQAVPSASNSTEPPPTRLGLSQGVGNLSSQSSRSANTKSISSPAQFIHNGTNLQRLKTGDPMPQKKHFMSTMGTTAMGARPVISADPPPVPKAGSSHIIGNRSVFSPMTLTIRTPPGAPAVNQALINSIVNNAEVQALLKRNPGQPITIVRVPEDPLDRRQHMPGVVTAKVVTSSNRGTGGSVHGPRRHPGRPRKEPSAVDEGPGSLPVRKRGRQPGAQIRRKDAEEYVPPVSWQPVKSRTRSGRISKPPVYRTENFKTSYSMERANTPLSDADGGSDAEADFGSRVAVTYTGRVKNYKCRNCSKAYIGRGGLARHFLVEPTHGNIEEHDLTEGTLQKPDHPTSEDVQNIPVEVTEREADDKAAEEETNSATSPTKVGDEPSNPSKDVDLESDKQVADSKAVAAAAEQPSPQPSEPSVRTRRGRQSNARKDDPDFQPGVSANKPVVKSQDKRKATMRQALKFLNREDYIDVCLPRLARHLSPWDFLVAKAELLKEDTPQVMKVLQLFEELVADVREMAVNCLEKVEDEDEDAGSLYLDEDDDLSRVLEFDKGWYKVSEPPARAADLPLSVSSLLKRTSEVITKGEFTDGSAIPIKIRKVQSPDKGTTDKPAQAQPSSPPKPAPKLRADPDPKHITVHVNDMKVTTEQGSSYTKTTLEAPLLENVPPQTVSDPQVVSTTDKQGMGQTLVSDKTPQVSSQRSNPAAQQQPLLAGEQPPVNPLDTEEPPAAAAAPTAGESSGPDTAGPGAGTIEQLAQAWDGEGQPAEPSSTGTQFVQAAEELALIAGSADLKHAEMKQVDPPDPPPQQETSVVVPEGSTIMQMQDGTFLVQRPDGTAMQIHTPEGMSIETVQELLSMEAGQG